MARLLLFLVKSQAETRQTEIENTTLRIWEPSPEVTQSAKAAVVRRLAGRLLTGFDRLWALIDPEREQVELRAAQDRFRAGMRLAIGSMDLSPFTETPRNLSLRPWYAVRVLREQIEHIIEAAIGYTREARLHEAREELFGALETLVTAGDGCRRPKRAPKAKAWVMK